MISTLKKLIPLSYKEKTILYREAITNQNYKHLKNTKKVFVFMAADYKNIGDAAITYAQVAMLRTCFPKHEVIEIPLKKSFTDLLAIKKVINPEDIITTIGGGNMGDTYYGLERIRQQIVKTFPKNRVIAFPQSYSFREQESNSTIHTAKKIYQAHDNLLVLIRDQSSLAKMKSQFQNLDLALSPDIVLTLDLSEPKYARMGILLMLRDDVESALNDDEKEIIKNVAFNHDDNITVSDTSHHKNMANSKYRNRAFLDFINTIKQHSIVITDRLHGVIFAYITKTPCIAINSKNSKVKNAINSYIKCDYIRLMEQVDIEELRGHLNYFEATNQINFSNKTKEYFKEVKKIIKNENR
ncbi:polysaccharide pyruvyl transferase family protein [Galbibacter sp. BG1]|uniref:polysaccharide pyruvyl transferase family protein n=1 Tax=Galbibacter sp. BG1 TaxID=1170699 RepID=UPI0015BD9CC0|nr:polysaccharide pyruvyl transferase family protein [Galbibacter sp. BG1]QLE02795.1 polysaccharide pyruvyl transferase family protein [Galbibacter sp. BG1]